MYGLIILLAATGDLAPMPQLMSGQRLRDHQVMLPQLEDKQTDMEMRRACLYTSREIPKVYQKDGTIHNPFYNISGDASERASGGPGNAANEFPWKDPFGAHGTNSGTFKGLALPGDERGIWPICYWRENNYYRLCHPEGTTYFEVMTIRNPTTRVSRAWEVRVRTRYKDYWDVDVFRPVLNWRELADEIEAEPDWKTNSSLAAAHAKLTGKNLDLRYHRMNNKHPMAIIRQAGWIEDIPALPHEFVDKLLDQPFKSAREEMWREYKSPGYEPVHAPSTRSNYSFVARNSSAGLIKISNQSCNRCHRTTNMHTDTIGPMGRGWYGRSPGSDGAMSSLGHLFQRRSISGNGADIPVHITRTRMMTHANPYIGNNTRYKPLAGIK